MKGKIAILALAAIFSFGAVSVAFADKAKDTMKVSKVSCKKQAKKMKFKVKKDKSAFMKACNKAKNSRRIQYRRPCISGKQCKN